MIFNLNTLNETSWKSRIHLLMKKNSNYVDDIEVSPRGNNFIPPVGKCDEIS